MTQPRNIRRDDQLYHRLRFPKRAEFLGQFDTYQVHLSHWSPLSPPFQDAFETVYTRGDSSILLIHGAQGSGKTLFCYRLEGDFDRARKGSHQPDPDNLWHNLVGGNPLQESVIRTATQNTAVRRIKPEPGWLKRMATVARDDQDKRVRIFLLDDAHRDVFICDWSGVSQEWYLAQVDQKKQWQVLGTMAQRMVEDCRGDFQRSIFVLVSNQREMMERLKTELDRWESGLATLQELPLPSPASKEKIIRTNTNRLNRVSYWYCLDVAGPTEKERIHQVLHDQSGFTDSFVAVDGALRKDRPGRPANRNVLTLVTLGTEPATVRSFLREKELTATEEFIGSHLGVFFAPKEWAVQMLGEADDAESARRAEMVQSEFALRWVTLDLRATYAVCQPPAADDLGSRLLEGIRFFPSVAKATKNKQRDHYVDVEQALQSWTPPDLAAFAQSFRELGQRRSTLYESALRSRLPGYSQALDGFPDVRPDFVEAPYQPCAVTSVKAPEAGTDGGKPKEDLATRITKAITRSCHVIEFTSFLRADLSGLDRYVLNKIGRYARLLESL